MKRISTLVIIGLLSLSTISMLSLKAQSNWVKHVNNPPLNLGPPGSCAERARVLSVGVPSLASDYDNDPRGEILDVVVVFWECYQGEMQEIYVEFHNPTENIYHYLVVVEVRDPSDQVKYDSNVVGENINGTVGGGQTVTWGPWYYALKLDDPVGTYHVLAGLRLITWDILDYRGKSWCEPEETFNVKPSHEYIDFYYYEELDRDHDTYPDALEIYVRAFTNAQEEVDVCVDGVLKNPLSSQVDSDSASWTIFDKTPNYSPPLYLYVPDDGYPGPHTVELNLIDESHRNHELPEDQVGFTVKLYPRNFDIYPPDLTEGTVDPTEGYPDTTFTFLVKYTDLDNDPADTRQLGIYDNGWKYYDMEHYVGEEPRNGQWFRKQLKGFSVGPHDFYFHFTDGRGYMDRWPDTGYDSFDVDPPPKGNIQVRSQCPDGTPFIPEVFVVLDTSWNEVTRVNPTSEQHVFQGIMPGTYIVQAGVSNLWVGADLEVVVQEGQTSEVVITVTFDQAVMPYLGLIEDYFPVWRFSADEKWLPTSFYFDDDADMENNKENYEQRVGRYNDKYAYVHIVDDGSYIEVQYWLYYAHNPLYAWHHHDWDSRVFICFDKTAKKPVYTCFFQHIFPPQFSSWDEVEKRDSTHVVVYVANGTHGSYPTRTMSVFDHWREGGVELTVPDFNWIVVGDQISQKKKNDMEFSLLYHATNGKPQNEPEENYWPNRYPPENIWGFMGATADQAPWLRSTWDEIMYGATVSVLLDKLGKRYCVYYPDEAVEALIRVENFMDVTLDNMEITLSIYDPDGIEVERKVLVNNLPPHSETPIRQDIWVVPTISKTGAYGIKAALKREGATCYECQYIFLVTKSPFKITPGSIYDVAWTTLETITEKVFLRLLTAPSYFLGGASTIWSLSSSAASGVASAKTETLIENPYFPTSSTVPLVNLIEVELGQTVYLVSKVYTGLIGDGTATITVEDTTNPTDKFSIGQQTYEIKSLESINVYTIRFTETFFIEGVYIIRTVFGSAYSEAKIIVHPALRSSDVSGDGTVNIVDIAIVALAFGTRPGDPNWNEVADIDKNAVITIIDIAIIATYWR